MADPLAPSARPGLSGRARSAARHPVVRHPRVRPLGLRHACRRRTPAGPGYDTGSFPTPSYDTGSVPTPTYDTGSFTAPAYDTGTFPTPSYGSGSFTTPTYESPLYDPPATSPYEATPSPYDTGNPTTYDETQAMPGPLFPPPAGEPWNAPAGDRP